MLHLLKRGIERRGKKLLRLGAVAAINDIEGVLVATTALPEIGNAWPSDGDGAGMRGERGASVDVKGKRERENEVTMDLRIRGGINGPYSKTVWAKSQLRFKVRHCCMPSPAQPHSPK